MGIDHSMVWNILLSVIVLLAISGAQSQTSDASCYIFGTQHVFTFDRQRIDFSTALELTVAHTCPISASVDAAFDISIINEYKYSNLDSASQAKCVKVEYRRFISILCANQSAMVDGDKIADSIRTSSGQLMIYYGTSGRELAIQVGTTVVRVSITTQSTITITVPESYQQNLCGLCGNYDGNDQNDLTFANGSDASQEVDQYQRGANIAQSYAVTEGTVEKFVPSECYNFLDVEMTISAQELCGVYEGSGSDAFSACVTGDATLAATFLDICKYDYCENYLIADANEETTSACGSLDDTTCVKNSTIAKEAVNSVMEVFVDVCKDVNLAVDSNWRADYNATLTCENGAYTPDGPYCPDVCGLPPNRCPQTGVDGCQCGSGEWREGDFCVASISCGCTGLTGDYYKVSEWWLDNLCTRNFTCTGSGMVHSTELRCSINADCSPTGCFCQDGFVGNGLTCDRTCGPGEQPTSSDECEACPIASFKEFEGTESCTSCPVGEITDEMASTSSSDCKEIVMAPEPSNSEIKIDSADAAFSVTVPVGVLPNGLPFGNARFRTVWASTNGVVSFGGDAYVGRAPMNLETDVTIPLLAPFWLRQDLRVPGGVSPITSKSVELSIGTFNKLEADVENLQEEAERGLNQINVLLSASESYRTASSSFVPNFAIVINWKNTVPNPAFFYSRFEVLYYQCVIVTNGDRTYAIYIYPSGGIVLRSVFQIRHVYMGYNVQDDEQLNNEARKFNYYKSGTPGIVNLDTDPSNTDVAGRWIFEVANYAETTQIHAIRCFIWYIIQRFYFFPFGLLEPLGNPCPCNKQSAEIDERFYYDYSAECAYSLNRRRARFSFALPFFQRCCYYPDGGSLITDPVQGGFPMIYHPLIFYTAYEVVDLSPYLHCCRNSDNCALYRQFRPVDQCESYRAPAVGGGFGDPHIFTLDNGLYTYNPIGEFWMIKSDNFSMQARMIQSLSSTTDQPVPATQFGAFVMQDIPSENSSVVQLEINNNRTDFEVLVDGESISNRFDSGVTDQVTAYPGVMLKKFNSSVSVSFESGFSFRFSIRHGVLSIQNYVPDSVMGFVDGLVGHFDGDKRNDITSRDGRLVCILEENCTNQIIHDEFGETWRIRHEESLFTYRNLWTTDTYTDLNFRPVLDFDSNDTALAFCDDDVSCMFDVFMTNDTRLGEDTKMTRLEVVEKSDVLGNVAPIVVGPSRINATVNQPITAMYYANYSGNYSAELNAILLPDGASFTKDTNGDGYTLSWTPTDLTPYSIRLSANETGRMTDTPSVSPIFEVSVKLSDDCENGQPDFDILAVGGLLTPTFCIVQCICDDGWIGNKCDEDYNGCIDSPCLVGNCTDISAANYDPSTNITFTCDIVDCPDGYEKRDLNGVIEDECSDVDECINGTVCTNAICINTVGSFGCICSPGYVFTNNSVTGCDDVNECDLGVDNCEQICANIDGGFNCSCNDGYALDIDQRTCIADVTTEQICNASNCEHTCLLNGTCTCPRGLKLNANGMTCDFINECNNGEAKCNTDSGAECHDLDVGYECRCPSIGYQPLVNSYDSCKECEIGKYGKNCSQTCDCGDRAKTCNSTHGCVDCNTGWEDAQCATDVDECLDVDRCGPIANCTNIRGSYYCLCPDGYTNQNKTHCQNINECTTLDPCSRLASCNDTEGSFFCTCNSGYTGNGINCYDINECSPLEAGAVLPCIQNATCKNELGSFSCECLLGFHGDGKLNGNGCLNDNECNEASNVCGGANNQCYDTEGSFVCRCLEGYTGDGVNCVDIDECEQQIYNCSAWETTNGIGSCFNQNGSYACDTTCNNGYNKTTDNAGVISCVPINECQADTYPCNSTTEVCVDTTASFECNCKDGFEKDNSSCADIDECGTGNYTCNPSPGNGVISCSNVPGSYECNLDCNLGYDTVSDTCVDINECDQNICNPDTETCENTDGSFKCVCNEGYAKELNTCTDINECLNGTICGEGGKICTNLQPFYNCSCRYGYEGDNCETLMPTAEFIEVEQVFGLEFNTDWASDARAVFDSLMSAALVPMYDDTASFLGVNILTVSQFSNTSSARRKRATTGSNTVVSYDVVFSEAVDKADVIHRALDYLISNDYMLTFNGTNITDLLMLAYPGVFTRGTVTCDTKIQINGVTSDLIDCQGQGTCEHNTETDYPMCVCDTQYEGYNCGDEIGITSVNLLALWISVAVAGALLLGGLLACSMVMVYQRRKRAPQLHRNPRAFRGGARAPAIFNPTSRLPAEAFNYQFPAGSIRDDLSDSSSTISGTTRRSQRTEGRVGSTVPFAPRWPRAYYAQLGDPDDS